MKTYETIETNDNINPNHYKNKCSLECIEAMRLLLGDLGVCYFCLGNAFKYLWRYQNKNGMEDLNKADWYLNHVDTIMNTTFKDSNCIISLKDDINKYQHRLNELLFNKKINFIGEEKEIDKILKTKKIDDKEGECKCE